MIIHKINKGFQIRSDKPDTNWLGEDWYLVSDGSDLALKIERLHPQFDFVLNENGELIDVIEIVKTETEITQEQINEIDNELAAIDSQGITRHLENTIEACNAYDSLYETTKELINKKQELRAQRAELVKKI
jgi:predicted nuclease with TOPRIM domain